MERLHLLVERGRIDLPESQTRAQLGEDSGQECAIGGGRVGDQNVWLSFQNLPPWGKSGSGPGQDSAQVVFLFQVLAKFRANIIDEVE
jgi:hypothetical protein